MKWFKHDSNANTDAKLEKLMIRYGLEGYGLYWFCLELIAAQVEKYNLTFELEHDSEIISHRTGLHIEQVQEIMSFIIDLKLFENDRGIITCLKMATRTDEYTQKILKTDIINKVPTVSRQSPDSVGIKSALIEEKEEKEEKERLTAQAIEVIKHLNNKTGKKFKPVDSNLKLVVARLKEGNSVGDITWVIDHKISEWKGNDYEKYLRPSTLFNAEKFNQYIGEKTKQSSYGANGI